MDLSHWNMAFYFTLNEVACLASGIEPIENSTNPRVLAIKYLLLQAYMSCRDSCTEVLHQNVLDCRSGQEETYAAFEADAFEEPGELPSVELRNSFVDALQQPDSKCLIPAKDDSMRFARGDLEVFFGECDFQPDVLFYNQIPKSLAATENHNAVTNENQGEMAFTPIREKTVNTSLATRERNSLVSLIAVLCEVAKLDYERAAKAAVVLSDAASRMGISLSESTIELHLKKIPGALAARMK